MTSSNKVIKQEPYEGIPANTKTRTNAKVLDNRRRRLHGYGQSRRKPDHRCRSRGPYRIRDYSRTVGPKNATDNKKSRTKEFELAQPIPLFGETALFGAVFAGDAQQFVCNMHKAFGRLEKVTEVYKARTERLNVLDDPNVCEGFSYEGSEGGVQALTALDFMIENSGNLAYEMHKNHLDRVEGAAMMLKGANRMADNEGCPTIY